MVTRAEEGCTCGGMAACQQCQERDAEATEIAAWSRLYAVTIAERDRARDIAVALEGQVAAVRAVADRWEELATEPWDDWRREGWLSHAHQIRAALDPDPAEET